MRRGFTLVEILVASTLLGVAFFAILNILPGSLAGMRHAHHLLCASDVAQRVMEQQRAVPFDSIAADTHALPDTVVDGTAYHTTLAVTSRSPRVKVAQVTVSWETSPPPPPTLPTSLRFATALYNFRNP